MKVKTGERNGLPFASAVDVYSLERRLAKISWVQSAALAEGTRSQCCTTDRSVVVKMSTF